MKNNNFECIVCGLPELVKVTMKNTKINLIVCKECNQVYEISNDGTPVFDHAPQDIAYFKNLSSLFTSWGDVEKLAPLNIKGDESYETF